MQNERRLRPRVALDARALVFLEGNSIHCEIVNISTSGVAMKSPIHRQSGIFIRFHFQMPAAQEWLDLDAVLVREERFNGAFIWGAMFFNLEPRTELAIRQYVRHQVGLRREQQPQAEIPSRPSAPTGIPTAAKKVKVFSGDKNPSYRRRVDSELASLYRSAVEDSSSGRSNKKK